MSEHANEIQTTDKKDKKDVTRQALFVSLRWKLLIGFTLLFSIVFALAFYWFYTFATQQALNRIQTDLVDSLTGSAVVVDADTLVALAAEGQPNAAGEAWLAYANAEENETADAADLLAYAQANFGEGTQTGFSDDPRYQALMDQLEQIHAIEPRAWPYLYVRGEGEREITYVVDLWARYDPSMATPFLFTRSSRRSYNGLNELTLRLDDNDEFTPYTDEWGQWVSAYGPILDQNGQPVAAIGIDFEASYVYEVQEAIRDRVAYAFLITYAGLFLLVFLISRTLTRPIQQLTVSAEKLGEGNYQELQKFQPTTIRDEIVTLADVFNIMADKVYQREQNLRKQVEALQIVIDEAKKEKQVSEIAETDFFRTLQAKAQSMRSRRKD